MATEEAGSGEPKTSKEAATFGMVGEPKTSKEAATFGMVGERRTSKEAAIAAAEGGEPKTSKEAATFSMVGEQRTSKEAATFGMVGERRTSKEAAIAAAEGGEPRTSKEAAASGPERELQSPPLPQIECPPCALRGSTLPVCGLRDAAADAEAETLRPRNSGQHQQRRRGADVRGNRASELRRQRSLQRADARDAAAVDDENEDAATLTSTVDAEVIDTSAAAAAADAEAIGADTPSTRDSVCSDDSDDSCADSGAVGAEGGVPAAQLHPSLVESLLKPSDGAAHEAKDRFLDTLKVTTSRPISAPSDAARARAHHGSPTSTADLNVAQLQAQLHEAGRQRDLLKDRIASLALLMRSSSPTRTAAANQRSAITGGRPGAEEDRQLQQQPQQPPPHAIDGATWVREDALAEAEPRRGLLPSQRPPPTTGQQHHHRHQLPPPHRRGESATVGVQAGGGGGGGGVADKATQRVDERLAALAAQVREAAATCAQLRLDRAAVRRELDAAKYDLRMVSADVLDAQSELAGARRELELRDDRIRQLTAAQSRAEKDAASLRGQLAEMKRQLNAAENSCQVELARNQRHRAQLSSLEAQLAGRMGELTAVTNALIEKRRSEEELLSRVQELQRALASSEDAAGRLSQQLAEERARLRDSLPAERSLRPQREEPPPPPPPPPPEQPTSSPPSPTAPPPQPPPAPEPAGLLEQRMQELDARIGRLVAEARSGAWRGQQQPPSQVVTSTPAIEPSSTVDVESLRRRTSQLEASNQQLTSDLRSLRELCSDLVTSRRQLKRRLSLSEQPQSSQPHQDMASYLLQTETLRAMISSQVRDLGSQHRQRPPLLLAEELDLQQETVNRCWRAVQRSFQVAADGASPRESPGAAASDATATAAGAYRDFYLKRRPRHRNDPPAADVRYSAGVLGSMQAQLD